jgi:two-component system OmpR family sensor kinase
LPRWTRLRFHRRAQLRTRVLVGVLLITLVGFAAFDLAAVAALRGYLLGQTDSQLRTVLSQAARGRQLGTVFPATAGREPPPPLQRALGEYYIVFLSGAKQTVIFGVGPDFVPRLPPGLHGLAVRQRAQTVISRNGRAQLRLRAARADGGTLVVSASLDHVNSTVRRLGLIVAIGSLAAAALIALGVAWVVRRGLRPVETMATQADRITAGDLTERVSPQDAGTEVGRLGAALNGMLARIEAAVDEREASQELMRRFFADASHELRNPLASLRANAELYQQGALSDRPQVDEAMRRIALEAQRMSGLVDDMLRLARLDQHPGQQHDPVDISALVTECTERAAISDRERTWQPDVAPGLVTVGDEELLRRAVDNLLANVHAHTPADTVASITATTCDDALVIEVSDDGPGVPADRLARIFDRFYRAAAQSWRPGSGLGLAIVTAIASAHDGTAQATLNEPHGLRVTLTLPAAQPAVSPAARSAVSIRAAARRPAASGRA